MNEIDIERLLAVMQAEVCDTPVPYLRSGVPANDAYHPIRLSDYENVYLLGRVTGVRKCPRRMSYAEVHRRLKAARQSLQTVASVSVSIASWPWTSTGW